MTDFWRLIGFHIALIGFMLVGGVALFRGDCLLTAVVKAIVVFAALWIAQSVLLGLLQAAGRSKPDAGQSDNEAV